MSTVLKSTESLPRREPALQVNIHLLTAHPPTRRPEGSRKARCTLTLHLTCPSFPCLPGALAQPELCPGPAGQPADRVTGVAGSPRPERPPAQEDQRVGAAATHPRGLLTEACTGRQ